MDDTVGVLTSDVTAAWAEAPCAALVVDRHGVVLLCNTAAAALSPAAAVGAPLSAVSDWLAEHHRQAGQGRPPSATVRGVISERSVSAHPVDRGDGLVTWWLVDDTDAERARTEQRATQRRARFCGETSVALLGSLNVRFCTEEAVRLATEYLADAVVVVTLVGGRRLHTLAGTTGGELVTKWVDAAPDGVPGLDEALRGFPPVPSRWLDPAATPPWLVPDGFGEVGSVMITPLPGHGAPIGALVLLRRTDGTTFDDDEAVVRAFAAKVGPAVSAARMFTEQSAVIETLLRDLLPPVQQHVAGADVAARYQPARTADRVGGDFYDIHPVDRPDDGSGGGAESLVVLGDVCGKGLDAAILAGKIRTTVKALVPFADDHVHLLDLLNSSLLTAEHTRFATLVLASVTRLGADVRLRVTCAGHPPPMVLRTGGQVEEIASRGTIIGALPEARATTAEIVLAPGETCLLFTDGITEARGPLDTEQFGEQRLAQVLAECVGMPAEAIAERVLMLVTRWIGQHAHDDIALLAITAPRGQHLTAVGGHGRGRYTA